MCMVKVEGMRGVTISCTLPAAEGMVVSTNDPEAVAARKGVMEFLLIHHPLDCPVCDKAGECTLQDHSYEHGPGHSRYIEAKTVRPKRNLGENIALWPERCIRCSRCIRFLDDITGTRLRRFPMPGPPLRLLGSVGDLVKRHVYDFQFPLTRDAMEYATQWPGTSAEHTERDFGLRFRDARETYTDTVRWLYEAGHLEPRHVGRLADEGPLAGRGPVGAR